MAVDKPATRSENKALLLALSGILLSILLAALDQTIVGTALPRIIAELNGFNLFAWVTTAYLLTSTATIPIAGKLGDIFGRKWLLLAADIIFLGGSFLSGAAPSMEWLIIFRGLQGIGAGALQSNAFAIIGELFPDSAKRARWQGIIAAVFGMASVFGPTLGGFITDNLNWRWVFYVNLPVGLIALPTLIFTLPHKAGAGRRKIDWWGALTITGAVVTLLLALSWGGQKEPKGYAWTSPQILGLLAAAVLLTGLFLWIETRVAEPILPLRLFRLGTIRTVSGIALVVGAVMLGTSMFIPLYVQVVQGQSAAGSGAIMTPLTLAFVVANILTGQFLGRFGRLKWPPLDGAVFLLVGAVLLLTLTATSPLWLLTIAMIMVGFGLGQIMPVMTIVVQETVERKDLGVGTSVVQFFRSIGSTIGTAVVGTVVTNSYTSGIESNPATSRLPQPLLAAVEEPQSLLNPQLTGRLPGSTVDAIRNALSDAIHNGFLITLIVGILAVLLVLTLPNLRLKTASRNRDTAANNGTEGVAQSGMSAGMVSQSANRPAQLETSGVAADSGQDRPGEGEEAEEPRSTFTLMD